MASYEKNKKNKWSVRFRIIEDGALVNKRLSGFALKKEAEAAYLDFMTNFESSPLPKKVLDFKQAVDAYFKYIEIEREVEDSTYITDKSLFDTHIYPFLENKELCSITDKDVREFKVRIKDYSYNFRSKVFGKLGSFFRFLDTYYDTSLLKQFNKVPNFKDKRTGHDINFWEYNEYKQFIQCVDDAYWALVFDTLYWSGCRKSEIFGLKVGKVNFASNSIKIDSQISYKTRNKDSKKYSEKRPKTKNSTRNILMPKQIVDRIKKLVGNAADENFVFGGSSPIAPETLRRKFDSYIIKANSELLKKDNEKQLCRITPHDLRHSHVSYIINDTSGGDLTKLYAIADRIGDSVEQVLQTYGHLFKSSQINLLNDIEESIKTDFCT